ncbi:MAG: thioredoxin family protein [Chitinophagales bacterium]|nr:thioredoxin family protein [Chitinophagales bacterium]
MKKLLFIIALLIGLGYLGYYYYYIPYFDNNQMGITDMQGQRVKFPQDQPYILCYIQTWCKDCVAETPCLMDFSKKQNIPIYFVTDEDTILLKKYRSKFDYELPIYLTKTRLKEKGILLFPTAFFYGKSNELLYNKMERIDSLELANYLGKLK